MVYVDGDIDAGIWTCGISVGLIHDIVSVAASTKRFVLLTLTLSFVSPPAKIFFKVSAPDNLAMLLLYPTDILNTSEIGSDAEAHIDRLAGLCASTMSNKQSREARL